MSTIADVHQWYLIHEDGSEVRVPNPFPVSGRELREREAKSRAAYAEMGIDIDARNAQLERERGY